MTPAGFHKRGISFFGFPRFEVRLPFIRGRTISGNDANVVSFYIHRELNVEARRSHDEIARQVLVLRIRFDDFVTVDGVQNLRPPQVASGQPHVDVIRPTDLPLANTSLDKRNRIIGGIPHDWTVWTNLRFDSRGPERSLGLGRGFSGTGVCFQVRAEVASFAENQTRKWLNPARHAKTDGGGGNRTMPDLCDSITY